MHTHPDSELYWLFMEMPPGLESLRVKLNQQCSLSIAMQAFSQNFKRHMMLPWPFLLIPYFFNQMLWLLFISLFVLVRLQIEGSYYSRVVFSSLGSRQIATTAE